VTPGYFQMFGIPILRGRAFAEADWGGRPAVILSESAARILFPGQDPLGHTVQLLPSEFKYRWSQPADVIGIAQEIRNTGPMLEPQPEIYAASWWDNSAIAYFAIRTQVGTAEAATLLKQAVADLDPRTDRPRPVADRDRRLVGVRQSTGRELDALGAFERVSQNASPEIFLGLRGMPRYPEGQRLEDAAVVIGQIDVEVVDGRGLQ